MICNSYSNYQYFSLFEKLAEQGDREYEGFLRVCVLEDCFTCQ